MIWDIIAAIFTTVSVVFAAVTYSIDRHRKKKVETLKELDSLWEMYHLLKKKNVKDDYNDFVEYMRKAEQFATGVKEKLYSRKVVEQKASIFFINQYNRFMKQLIAQRRKQFNRDNYYHNIEELVKSFSVTKKE